MPATARSIPTCAPSSRTSSFGSSAAGSRPLSRYGTEAENLMIRSRLSALALMFVVFAAGSSRPSLLAGSEEQHLLYVAVPGVRNYVEHGGVGILVYDVTGGHRFMRRIPAFDVRDGQS